MEKKAFSKHFGMYLKATRLKKGMSQSDLADALGNNFQNISAIERGEFTPTIHTVQKIADAFQIQLSELIIGFESFLKQAEI